MRREVAERDLEKLYDASDMAKIGCGGCAGCWDCCCGMGESIILDPLDAWRLVNGLQMEFPAILQQYLELQPVDGVILPNLRMMGEEEQCPFLNEQKRCAIHAFRPGLCRLFPLGRIYEDGGFRYFVQQQECRAHLKTKVKISKWLEIPDIKQYEKFVLEWHNLQENVQSLLREAKDEQLARDINVYLLESFYLKPYSGPDFYGQFEERKIMLEKLLKTLRKE